MNGSMNFGKHRVNKERQWYGSCGTCGRVVWNPAWSVTMDLLELHVREHLPQHTSLTTEG